MRYSISTILWLLLTIGLSLGLYVALNQPSQVLIRNDEGWRFYEFEDSVYEFDSRVDEHVDLKPSDFPHIVSLAKSTCSDLEAIREETGFYNWEIEYVTYETLTGTDKIRHAYSITITGHEYPSHLGINTMTSVDLFFISKNIVLYSAENSEPSLSEFLPSHDLIYNATPEVPNPRGGGIFQP